jgi:putative transcriptional regulator
MAYYYGRNSTKIQILDALCSSLCDHNLHIISNYSFQIRVQTVSLFTGDVLAMESNSKENGYLEGQMLVAMPSMQDKRFEKSVIYLCAHSDEGAMGIVVNRVAELIDFSELLEQLNLETGKDPIEIDGVENPPQVLRGGPVEPGRGFVLHSGDYFTADSTLPIAENICLTATLDILKAIAKGAGPESSILALGYSGWAPGQLEEEIQMNGWLNCPADQDLIFGRDLDSKYSLALAKIGVDPHQLSSDAGHA